MKNKYISIKKFFGSVVLSFGMLSSYSQTITTACGTGTAGYSGDNGLAVNAQVDAIYSQMCIDNAGNLYIADDANNRIRKISASTGSITTIAGTGAYGFAGDGGSALSAQFKSPDGIAIDNAGNLFISDYANHRIRMITPTGTITTICGNGTASSTGDGGLATAATINSPGHLWLDPSGNLYITEFYGNRIRKISSTGTITTVMGNGTYSNAGDGGLASAATIAGPWEIVGDKSGNIYVASYQGSYIRKISTTGSVTAFAGINGSPGYSGDNGPALTAQLGGVTGLGINDAGDIFLADSANHRIRRVAVNGTITSVAGTGTLGYSGDGGPAITAQVSSPNGSLAFYGCTLYFIDAGNARIRKIVGTTPTVTAVSSNSNFICTGSSATLTANGGSYYTWNPGGNGNSIVVSPTVTSSYSVVGTGTNGCQSSAVISQSVSSCTGLGNTLGATENMELRVYPNPNNGEVSVEVTEGCELQIMDLLGREIRAIKVSTGKAMIDMKDLPNGTYILKSTNVNGVIRSQKFIKQ